MPLDTYSINDDRITKHLKKELRQDEHTSPLRISIKDFQNEKGWFMLWHLSVAANGTGGKTIPIFINENGILRPMAGKRIWDAILDEQRSITVQETSPVTSEEYEKLKALSMDYAYDSFCEMRSEYEQDVEENHRKYDYALSLRFEAAERIGIDNIRSHKLNSLAQEKVEMENQYRLNKQICPDFYLELLAYME